MTDVRVVGRRRSPLERCAYCHAPLPTRPAPCAGCGALLHRACRDELGRCPTPGCAHARADPAPPDPVRHAPAGGWTGRPRGSPRLWARLGPYSRLLLSGVLHGALLLCAAAFVLMVLANPRAAWSGLLRDEDGLRTHWSVALFKAGTLAFFLGLIGRISGGWLRRLPAVWREVGELLDRGRPAAMRLVVQVDTSDESERVWCELSPLAAPDAFAAPLSLKLEGLLPPRWLRRRSGEEVLVYGLPPPGPYVLEFQDGLLALVHPD